MRTQRSSFENSSLRKSRSHGSFVKKGALAAAVALCCLVGVGTAIAATASPQDGTAAPAGMHAAVQTLAAADAAADAATDSKVGVLDDETVAEKYGGYDFSVKPYADYPTTTVEFDVEDSSTHQVGVYITVPYWNLYDYAIYVDWGDGSVFPIDDPDEMSDYWYVTHRYSDNGKETVTIYADTTSTEWAYDLGYSSSNPFLPASSQPYLTSIKTAANAGLENYSFYASSTGSYSRFTTADFSECSTSGVTDMSNMFAYCTALETLDLSGFDTSSATNMSDMFEACTNLYEITLGENFKLDPSTNSLPTPSFTKPYVATGTWQYRLADGTLNGTTYAASEISKAVGDPQITWCASSDDTKTLVVFDLTDAGSSLQPSLNLYVYAAATPLTIDWGNGSTQTVTGSGNQTVTKSSPYSTAGEYSVTITSSYTAGPAYLLGQGSSSSGAFVSSSYQSYLTLVRTASNAGVQSYAFYGSSSSSYPLFTKADFSICDTSSITDMRYMFYYCRYLTSLDVSGFDTKNVTNMSHMFYYCHDLTALDVSGFDTSNVTAMDNMFYYCFYLTSLDVSGFDTKNVTNMAYMFYYCFYLTSLDVSGFDTSNVTNMADTFYECRGLTSLDLTGWDTAKVTMMDYMFYYCDGLTSLDVASWNTAKVTQMTYMFAYCTKITSLDLSGWSSAALAYNTHMFGGMDEAMSSLRKVTLSKDFQFVEDGSDPYPENSCLPAQDFTSPYEANGYWTEINLETGEIGGTYSVDWRAANPLRDAHAASGTTDTYYATATDPDNVKFTASDFTVSSKATLDVGEKSIYPQITTELLEGTEYAVSYSPADPNDWTIGSTVTMTISGRGNYENSTALTYTLTLEGEQTQITASMFTVDTANKTYTGSPITPSVTPTTGLVQDRDYTVSYTSNTDAGTASITIQGIGNYTGTLTYYFTIEKAPATPSNIPDVFEATYGDTLADLDLSTYNDTSGTWAWADGSTSVGNAGEQHSFTAVYTPYDTDNYESDTTSVTVTVVARTLSYDMFTVDTSSALYHDGEPITKDITGSYNGAALVLDTDYTVAYEDNVHVGTATITISGTGNFTGELTYTFTITEEPLTYEMFEVDLSEETYTGSAITKDIVTDLPEADYEVAYSPNVNVGEVTITITGHADYAGALTYTFDIVAASLQEDWFSVTASSTTYTGDDISVTVENTEGLEAGTDYTWSVEPAEVKAAGTYTVTVTGSGNYTGDVELTFTVATAELQQDWFTVTASSSVYTGDAISVTVENSAGLTYGTDYTWSVEPEEVKAAGTYTVTVTGEGSCTGDLEYTFEIAKAALEEGWFSVTPSSSVYTGEDISVTVENSAGLTEETDYTWAVEPGTVHNAGSYTVTVTGCGNWEGTFTYDLTIEKASLQQDWFSVTASSTTYTGDDISVTVENTEGLEAGTDYTWSVEPDPVHDAGSYTVTVTGSGNWEGTFTYDLTIEKAASTPTDVPEEIEAVYGQTLADLDLSAYDDEYGTWAWADDAASVGNAGEENSFTAVYTPYDTANFEPYTTEVTVTVTAAALEQGWFTVTPDTDTYTGEDISVTVDNSAGLTFGTDYTWSVEPDPVHDAGSYTVTVTGCGDYAGSSLTYTFEIAKAASVPESVPEEIDAVYGQTLADLDLSTYDDTSGSWAWAEDTSASVGNAGEENSFTAIYTPYDAVNYEPYTASVTVTVSAASLQQDWFAVTASSSVYIGDAIDVTVTNTAGLTYGTDYTWSVEPSEVKDAGTYTVTVTGCGNWDGELTYTFTIEKAAAEPERTPAALTAVYGDTLADLDLSAYDDGNGFWSWADEDTTPVGSAGSTYTFTAIYTPYDTDNFESVTAEVTVTVLVKGLEQAWFAVTASSYVYTGDDISVTVENSEGLEVGTDYTWAVEPGTVHDAGTYVVTVTGCGDYADSFLTYAFTIAPVTAELAWVDVNHPDADVTDGLISYVYDGTASDIAATVSNLIAGDECAVSVSGGTQGAAGTHMATAVELSNANYALPAYASCLYYIEHATLTEDMFAIDTSDVAYTGEEIKPGLTSSAGLEEDTDYTVDYANNTEVGTASVTVTGIGGYTGKVVFHFRIVQAQAEPEKTPADLSATYGDKLAAVSLEEFADDNGSWAWAAEDPDQTYVGDAGESVFVAVYTPNDDADYAPCYADVTISVARYPLEGMEFTVENTEQEYTGYAIYASVTGPEDVVTGEPMAEGADFTVAYYAEDDSTTPVTPKGVADYAFTISGMGNYTGELADASYVLTIEKASPSIDLPPADLTATYGDTLEDVILPRSDESADSWGWSWDEAYFEDEDIDETGHFTHAGTFSYYALFTPEDSVDYESYDEPLEVTVLSRSVELEWADETYTEDMNRVYDAQASNVAATVSEASLVNGDEPMDVTVEGGDAADAGAHVAVATALADGNYTLDGSASATCAYFIEHASAAVVPNDASKTYGGSDPALDGQVEGLCEGDTLGEVSYTRADGEDVGTYAITAACEDANPNYSVTYERGTLTIDRASIADMDWAIDDERAVYSGQPIEKQVTAPDDLVKAGTPLAEGTDYTCTYFNNTDAGTATLAVTGAGNYTGVWMTTFTIAKATPTYTEPAGLTAVYGQTLGEIALGDGWTWDEGEAASVGDAGTRIHKATYTPEDTANYESVPGVELTVAVSAKKITGEMFTVDTADAVRTGEAIVKSVLGVDGRTYLVPDLDYTVAYENNTDVGTATITIAGQGNYTGELVYTFEIFSPSGTTLTKGMFEVDTADATYTGGAIEPSVTSGTLSAGTDYEVAYTHNTDVGTAIVTISGKGEYAGELTYTFEIVPAGLTAEMFTIEEGDATYTGHQVVREIGGTYNGAALVEGSDYSVSYADNVDAGTASVTVTGHGNYTGTATLTFEIAPATITEAMFTVDTDDATYTGEPITKSVSSEDLAGHDYTVAYENNTEVGTATITIAGMGNYTGAITYTFEIVAAPETGNPDTGKPGTGSDTPKVGDTFEYDGGQYTVTSSTTARYNWPLPTTTKANVATTIVRGGKSLAVTAIDKNAFKGNKKLTVIKVGDNVKKIPDKAFSKCTKVTKVNLGTGVKTVGKQACANMKKLKKATFKSKTLKQIGAKCFKGDKKLKTVTIKSTKLKKIGASAFKGCNKLKTLVIKSTKLSSKNITKALKGSKIKTIKLTFATSSTKKLHKKLVKRYTKAFSKGGSGNKVTVK